VGKVIKWVFIAIGILIVVTAVINWQWIVFLGRQYQMFMSPTFDHQPPEIVAATNEFAVLGFSKTNGYRHHLAIPAARDLLDEISAKNNWFIFHTENAAVFNIEQLKLFDVVVLNNTSGTIYTTEQQQAFVEYIETGGGIVAIHAAGGDPSYDWNWYVDELIRAQFVDHPMKKQFQQGVLNVETKGHPVVAHIDSPWERIDEWYNFEDSPRPRVNVLLTIDETSYDPERSPMGDDHPMAWWHRIGSGKVVYSALGHVPETYSEPPYKQMLVQAIIFAGEQLEP